MYLLHQIGARINSNFNTIDEIVASEGPISFDGIYTSVYEHYKALKGKDVTFFVSGKYLGGDNSFDVGQPLTTFCTLEQVQEMADYLGAKIGYHGWAHRRCVRLTRDELAAEMAVPDWDTSRYFAWPHGIFDQSAIEMAKWLGYSAAYAAGPHGDGSQFQRKRRYLNW